MAAVGGPNISFGQEIEETNQFNTPCDEELAPKIGEIPRLIALCAAELAEKNLPIEDIQAMRTLVLEKRDEKGEIILDENDEPILERKRLVSGIPHHKNNPEMVQYVQIFKDRVVPDYDDGSGTTRPAIVINKKNDPKKSDPGSDSSESSVAFVNPNSIFRRVSTMRKRFLQVTGLISVPKNYQSIKSLSDVDENALMDLINIGFYEGTLKRDKETLSFLLKLAVKDNKTQIAKKLLEEINVDVQALDDDQLSLMMYAALNGNLELIESLKRALADPNQACSVGIFNLIKMMLAKNRAALNGFISPLSQYYLEQSQQFVEMYAHEICESLDDEFILETLNKCRDKITKKYGMTPEELISLVKKKVKDKAINFKSLERLIAVKNELVLERIPKDVIRSSFTLQDRSSPRLSMTPLMMAAISGNVKAVLSLITTKTQPQEIQAALLIAAALGHTPIIKALIDKKLVDINSQRFFLGFTPLMLATLMQRNETVEFLLQNNARMDLYPDLNSMEEKNFQILAAFLREIIGLPMPDAIKQIKFSSAVIALTLAPGLNNFEMIRLFAENGADFSVLKDENDLKVLALFLGSNILREEPQTLDYLLSQGIDINTPATEFWGLTLFHLLTARFAENNLAREENKGQTKRRFLEILEIIFQKSDCHSFDEDFLEIIGLFMINMTIDLNPNARIKERQRVTNILLKKGAEIDSQDTARGLTPFMRSIISGDFDMAEILVKNGADPNRRSFASQTVLHLVAENDIMMPEEENYQVKAVELLLKNGADPNPRDSSGRTPIIYCVNDVDLVRMLLEAGADPDIEDHFGNSALHYATRFGSDEAFKLILDNEEKPVDLNLTNASGETALSIAQNCGDVNRARMLLEKQNKSKILSLALTRMRYLKRNAENKVRDVQYRIDNFTWRHERKIQAVGFASIAVLSSYLLYNHPGPISRVLSTYLGGVWNQTKNSFF